MVFSKNKFPLLLFLYSIWLLLISFKPLQQIYTTDVCQALTKQETIVASPDKIALIVAISRYAPETGWSVTAAAQDALLIKAALAAQGFDTMQQVTVLRDAQATKQGITEAIRQHLISKARQGSTVVFHFSGHGQQVADTNGDEIDGLDEALVPYDAPKQTKGAFTAYRGEKHLRDDELGALLTEVRQKIGPEGSVLVVLDACHSGTATRQIGTARGTQFKIAPEGYSPKQVTATAEDGWSDQMASQRLASMVVISGSSANELNYETQDEQGNKVGPLSYALSRNLVAADANSTYLGLFDKIRVAMSALAPTQTPRIEGDTDQEILGGNAVQKPIYYTVKSWFGSKDLSINAGALSGLYNQSVVAFYDIDVKDTAQVAYKG